MQATQFLKALSERLSSEFVTKQRVLSFDEYLDLVARQPLRQARTSAQYVVDCMEHFGTTTVRKGGRDLVRFNLFDGVSGDAETRVIGQETVQADIHRVFVNFTHEGRVGRLVLLHGPNGSGKSSLVAALMSALERYSHTDEGALYRFNWIFPNEKISKTTLGFGGDRVRSGKAGSYAYLQEEDVEARIPSALRDHPLLLLPPGDRVRFLDECFGTAGLDIAERPLGEMLHTGDLEPKSRAIFDALLSAHKGDIDRVLQHVQVERFYLSRRYRHGLVTIEPQMHVDASAQQITMDKRLNALPPVLQNLSLIEPTGDLVDGNRGLIEYNDLLKKPVDAFKYLLATCEKTTVALPSVTLYLDTIFVGSSNEKYLAAFKEHPDFPSFKGRMDLVRTPYLLSYVDERAVYDEQITQRSVHKHIAPHATWAAGVWAVLTRMRRPTPEHHASGLRDLISRLTPLEKADLYALGRAPRGLSLEKTRELVGAVPELLDESDGATHYEGKIGASPREMRTILLNAAQNPLHPCLTPLAIFEELEDLVRDKTVYDFLKMDPVGDYHNHARFIEVVKERWLALVDDDLRSAMGLVGEEQYVAIFARYITHASYFLKREKVFNPITGKDEDPDTRMMEEIEMTLGINKAAPAFRSEIVATAGAWKVENPTAAIDYRTLFADYIEALRNAYFEREKTNIQRHTEDLLHLVAGDIGPLGAQDQARLRGTLTALKERFGYCEGCARESIGLLLRERYAG